LCFQLDNHATIDKDVSIKMLLNETI
jgi:hypothetical protein